MGCEDLVEVEDVNGVGNVNVNKLKDLEDVEMLRGLYEPLKEKNKKLYMKLRSKAYAEKIKLLCFVVSHMIKRKLVVKYNYSL